MGEDEEGRRERKREREEGEGGEGMRDKGRESVSQSVTLGGLEIESRVDFWG